jgi:hypothetical protein
LQTAFLARMVLVFRDMETTPVEHLRSRRVGLGLSGGILVGLSVLAAGCSSTDGGLGGGVGGQAGAGVGGQPDAGVGGQGGAGVGGQPGTGGDPRPALLARLTAAEATWAAGAPCTTYHYSRLYFSFVGNQATTVQIAEPRALFRRQWSNLGQSVPTIQWTEGPDDIGSHGSGGGNRPPFPASTVAQLFAECRDILNQSPAEFDLTLVVDDRGLPTTCHKRMIGYVDDVQSGIDLIGFACGSLDPCAGPGCIGSGPYEYDCFRLGACDPSAVCTPLSDGVSCGAGTCLSGTCQ